MNNSGLEMNARSQTSRAKGLRLERPRRMRPGYAFVFPTISSPPEAQRAFETSWKATMMALRRAPASSTSASVIRFAMLRF